LVAKECIGIGRGNQRRLRDRIRLLQLGQILLHRPRYLRRVPQLLSPDPAMLAGIGRHHGSIHR
jgi:hypothetical protein